MFGSFFKVEKHVLHSGTIKKMKFAMQIGEILLAFALTLPTFSIGKFECTPVTRSTLTRNQADHLVIIMQQESVDSWNCQTAAHRRGRGSLFYPRQIWRWAPIILLHRIAACTSNCHPLRVKTFFEIISDGSIRIKSPRQRGAISLWETKEKSDITRRASDGRGKRRLPPAISCRDVVTASDIL